ncbi:hypothetical protein B5G26_06510 [Anaerotignum lactatifermentans]|uniref:Uncharacterized protein n=1 Tax=Anaerotignum lactatifermentans TaxID=160404 RepID=A0A1Y3U721_9FIRM|nr:hypothetical protein B5G26_06510 [Anaerotignum lactatifermentans]
MNYFFSYVSPAFEQTGFLSKVPKNSIALCYSNSLNTFYNKMLKKEREFAKKTYKFSFDLIFS